MDSLKEKRVRERERGVVEQLIKLKQVNTCVTILGDFDSIFGGICQLIFLVHNNLVVVFLLSA